jgi:uncharacterized protein YndB with AHSA1/START domain
VNSNQPHVLTISREIAAPVSAVWRALTTPSAMAQWMLVPGEVVPDSALTTGSRIEWRDAAGAVYLAGTVTACQPQARLTVQLQDASRPRAARPGEVVWDFTLTRQGRRTRLEYRLGDLGLDPDAEGWMAAYREADEPARLAALVEGALHDV